MSDNTVALNDSQAESQARGFDLMKRRLQLALCGAAVILGIGCLVWTLVQSINFPGDNVYQAGGMKRSIVGGSGLALTLAGLVGFAASWAFMVAKEDRFLRDSVERNRTLFGRALVGLGFALLCVAVGNAVSIITLSYRNRVTEVLYTRYDENQLMEGDDTAIILSLSFSFALLGALFFFCTSIWKKIKQDPVERYDNRLFWAGLWFRLGEALIFSLVIFLVLVYAKQANIGIALLVISLLMGMFLKAGEATMQGLSARVFRAFEALLPIQEEAETTAVFEYLVSLKAADNLESNSRADELRQQLLRVEGVKAVTLRPQPGNEKSLASSTNYTLRVRYDARRLNVSDLIRLITLAAA